MRAYLFIILTLIVCSLLAQTDIPAGYVSGTWTAEGSPYLINGNIEIPNGQILTIEPGVLVEFQGHYRFNVQGRLLAEGTEEGNIIFTPSSLAVGWKGIQFDNVLAMNDSSKVKYCVIKSVYKDHNSDIEISEGGGITIINTSKIAILKSQIKNNNITGMNGGGIYCFSSNPVIKENLVYNNHAYEYFSADEEAGAGGRGGGIYLAESNAKIIGNEIMSNYSDWGGGVHVNKGNPFIKNNLVINNDADYYGGGLNLNSSSSIINNTIVNNSAGSGGGIYDYKSRSNIINTIIWGNDSIHEGNQVYVSNYFGEIGVSAYYYNCCIQDDIAGFGGHPFVGNSIDIIDSNPQFQDAAGNNFYLTPSSPCVDEGAIWSRLDENNTLADIGAFTGIGFAGSGNMPNGYLGGIHTSDILNNTIITENLIIPEDVNVAVSPGVQIQVLGHIEVYGNLNCIGTENNPITFELKHFNADYGYWYGISLYGEDSSNSQFEFTEISGSTCSGLTLYSSSPVISNCEIFENAKGIECFSCIDTVIISNNIIRNNDKYDDDYAGIVAKNSNVKIISNQITDNIYANHTSSSGIYLYNSDSFISDNNIVGNGRGIKFYGNLNSGVITNNVISENLSYGVDCRDNISINNNVISDNLGTGIAGRNSIVANNLINDNQSTGLVSYGGSQIINNTIVDNFAENGGGIRFYGEDGDFYNNIIWENSASESGNQVYIYMNDAYEGNPNFYYNDIQGGIADFGFSEEAYFFGDFQNNLDIEPEFLNSGDNSYQLNNESYCINSGILDITELPIPVLDLLGNPRIYEGDVQRIDIGAYEYQGVPSVVAQPMISVESGDYVNPFLVSIECATEDASIHYTTDGSVPTLLSQLYAEPIAIEESLILIIKAFKPTLLPSLTQEAVYNIGNYYNGNVSGIWETGNSPFLINGDIFIEDGDSLTIQEGIDVVFTGSYSFNIQGSLKAIGTEENQICFTSNDTLEFNNFESVLGGWKGIRLIDTPTTNDSTIFQHCKFDYCKFNENDALRNILEIKNFSKVVIDNCVIEKCQFNDSGSCINLYNADITVSNNFIRQAFSQDSSVRGVTCERSDVLIYKNQISNLGSTTGYSNAFTAGIVANYDANLIIESNMIFGLLGGGNYGSAIRATGSDSYFIINNNLIYDNTVLGINISENALITNNTIYDNCAPTGAGIRIRMTGSDDIFFFNNIIYNNRLNDQDSTYCQVELIEPMIYFPDFYYCDIQDGVEGFSGVEFEGEYIQCIDSDPLFIDPENSNFQFLSDSPSINAGTSDTTGLNLPEFDLAGNSRIYNDIIDMGCYEWQGTEIIDEEFVPSIPVLLGNYPNPFNPSTTISFSIPTESKVNITVYNIKGQTVKTLTNEKFGRGNHQVLWHGKDSSNNSVASGVYFYKLQVDGKEKGIKKMLLLK